MGSLIGGSITAGCFVHGIKSIEAIFGQEDANRMLAALRESDSYYGGLVAHPLMSAGVALIPSILVLSRLSVADSVLPIFPLIFFATHPESIDTLDPRMWPPSAALSFAVLPYLRSAYNQYYQRVWAPHEKRWLKEIQPRHGDDSSMEGNEAGPGARGRREDERLAAAGPEEGLDLEIVFEGAVEEELQDERPDTDAAADYQQQQIEAVAEQRRNEAPPLAAPPLANNETQDQPQANLREHVAAQAAAQGPLENQNRQDEAEGVGEEGNNPERLVDANIVIPAFRIADSILGALLFPSISGALGELLKLGLPRSWVTPSRGWNGKTVYTGLLQQKWGRSLVGGCLFVVLKDFVSLYVKWRQAQAHQKRRILDYDKEKGRVVG